MRRPAFTFDEIVALMTAIDYAIDKFRYRRSEYEKQRLLEYQELKQKVLKYGASISAAQLLKQLHSIHQ